MAIDDYVQKVKNKFFNDVEIYGCDAEAPNSYKALRMWRGSPCLPVYTGNCEGTIFETPDTNILMRGVHDLTHLKYGLSFKAEDEIECARHHAEQFKKVGAPLEYQKMIFEDTHAQVCYYQKYGNFINDQKGFVGDVVKHGLEAVLASEKRY